MPTNPLPAAHHAHGESRILTRFRGLSLAAVSVVALSACGATTPADFAEEAPDPTASVDTEADESSPTTVELEPVAAGFLSEEVGKDITTSGTIRPEKAEVVTPAGTLKLTQVQTVDSLTPEQIGLEAVTDDGSEVLAYGPAEGEVFRVVDLSFVPWEGAAGEGTTAELSISIAGSQQHLHALDQELEVRLLASLPEGGSTQFVVSSEGHDQFVDVLTGERADDDVAAAYYRSNTVQEPHHKLTIESISFPTETTTGPYGDLVTDLSYEVDSATLSAWTNDGGWAEPGSAWMAVTWGYDLGMDVADSQIVTEFASISSIISVDVAGEVTTDELRFEDKYASGGIDGEHTTYVAVPVDVTGATISFSGSLTADIPHGMGVTLSGETSADFASDEYELSFPAEG